MRTTYELDRHSFRKEQVLEEINRKLDRHATIRGDEVEVDGGSHYEREVEDILRRYSMKYSKR